MAQVSDIPSHHLIYGLAEDFITGEQVVDTDDERERQKLARLLVREKNFTRAEIEPRLRIETLFAGQFVTSTVDFTVSINNRRLFIIRYAPGSLVTRERPAIAAARVLDREYQIPLAVVTNGRDAELIDTASGKVIASGLAAIPERNEAARLIPSLRFEPLSDPCRREREMRILNAYDVEICCSGGPCALPSAPEG